MTRRLHVASVWSNLYGCGGGNRAYAFAQGYDRDRFRFTLVVMCRGDIEQRATFGSTRERFREAGVDIVELDEPPWPTAALTPSRSTLASTGARVGRTAARLRALFTERGIDVADVHGDACRVPSVLATRFGGPPIIATTFDNYMGRNRVYEPAGRWCYRRAHAVVSDSYQRGAELERWLAGRGASRVRVIPNGIEPPISPMARSEARRALGLAIPDGEEVVVIGQVSRLIAFKGHLDVLAATADLLRASPRTHLLFCGYPAPHAPTDYVASLRARAAELGIADRLHVISYPGPIADVWAAIDVHVHASTYDSSPISVIEAMSLGKPSAVMRTGGLPELVIDGTTGLVVPPSDVPALRAALTRLLTEPELAARLGHGAAARFRERHAQATMVRRLEDLFASARDDRKATRKLRERQGRDTRDGASA